MNTVLCFWNPCNIGDVYMMSFLLRRFCLNNPNETFYWVAKYGDVFFEGIPNLKYIHHASPHFKINERNNTDDPNANIWWNTFNSRFGSSSYIAEVNARDTRIIAINAWVVPVQTAIGEKHLGWKDFDVDYMIKYFNYTISNINNKYNVNHNLITKENLMNEYYNNKVVPRCITSEKVENTLDNDKREKIFVFNFKSISVGMPMAPFLDYFYNQAVNNPEKLYILSQHDQRHCSLPNVISCDVDLGISVTMDCSNLLKIWGVAKYCSNIYLTPTGATWTFLHMLDEVSSCTFHMWQGGYYVERLNKIVKMYTNDEKALIHLI